MDNKMAKILVVEDEESIAHMYKFRLEQAGHEVEVAINGQQGLEAAERFRPELMLIDIMMPVMTGDELLRIVREKDWGSDIKVIILTNISRAEAPSKLRLLRVNRFVVKAAYTPTQVLGVVEEVLATAPKSS